MRRKPDEDSGLPPARRHSYKDLPTRSPERAISKSSLRDRRIGNILKILREIDAQPRNWQKGSDAWKKRVALKHGAALGSLYRWKNRFDESGIAGLEHHKSNVGPRVWTPAEALDFWIGLCLKPTQRESTLKALYEDLIREADLRGWRVGGWSSARGWLTKKAKELMGILP